MGIAVPVSLKKRLRFRVAAKLTGPDVAARPILVPFAIRGPKQDLGCQAHPISGVHMGSG